MLPSCVYHLVANTNTVGVAVAGMNPDHHGAKMPSEHKMEHTSKAL